MVYIFVRIALCAVILVTAFVLIRYFRPKDTRGCYILSGIVAFLVVALAQVFPPENLFVSFPSAEASYRYSSTGEVVKVVEGENSALVYGKNRDKNELLIIREGKNGWKGARLYSTWPAKRAIDRDTSVTVYHCRNTNDYYVKIIFYSSNTIGPFEILDNRDSQFQHIKTENGCAEYCAYVKGLDDTYTLTINGEVVEFNQ